MKKDDITAVRSLGAGSAAPRDADPIYSRILDSMTCGVMFIDVYGVISEFNPVAAELLGVDPGAVVRRSLAEVFLLDETFEEFNEIVLSAMYDGSVGHQGVANVSVGRRTVPLSVATSFLYDTSAEGGDEYDSRLGVVAVFSDISEIERLRTKEVELARELETRHTELRGAYVDLEERNAELGGLVRRMRTVRTVASLCAIMLVAGIGTWLWSESPAGWVEMPQAHSGEPAGAKRFVTVEPTRIASTITVTTEIKPRREVAVTSPILGRVGVIHVQHGETVAAGQPLLELDVTEATIKHRAAQMDWLRAEAKVEELASWTNGIDASRAKRAVTKARIAFEAGKTRSAQMSFLFEQGLVPAVRKDAAEREQSTRRLDLEAAEQDLEAVLAKGGESHEVARLALANARAQLEQIERVLRNSTIAAPVSGVVLHRRVSSARGGDPLSAGTSVEQGQHLLTIGDMEGVTATGRVDEVDVRRIRPGQGVRIAGPAFPGVELDARIVHVSSQASKQGGRGLPSFEVAAVVEKLSPAQREAVRLGMSADMEIVIYENDEALVVPARAVDLSAGSPRVRIRDAATDAVRAVAVKTGITTIDSVEIREGVAPGDRVLVP